jgi:hypothetical protein
VTPFEAKLSQRIDEELTRLRGILENRTSMLFAGKAGGNYDYTVGQIDALKRVSVDYFAEVNEDLNKEK